MVKERDMNQAAFERFLAWLDPDRDEAGKRCEEIQRWLIRLSQARGRTQTQAEEIADVTINRVVTKVPQIADTYVGPRQPYFYGVWRKVLLEFDPWPPPPPPPPPPDDANEKERRDACLEQCLKTLLPAERQQLLDYYADEGGAKIKRRRALAERLGISENALRIRLTRLRGLLRQCIGACLKQSSE
jgi:DNA-directed RNA polymerase specialized sigma24 family protein